nr:AP-2 complex subunit mu [Tanacetum cinerariifolium]
MVDAFRMRIMQTKELGTCLVRQIRGCSFFYIRTSNVYIVVATSYVGSSATPKGVLRVMDTLCGGVSASNWLKRTRYETQHALPLSSEVFSFKGAINEFRTSKTDAFEKYSQLCERNVAPRLAATEVGGLYSSSRLKRTCYETQLSFLVVSLPSSFRSSVNEPIISGTFLPAGEVGGGGGGGGGVRKQEEEEGRKKKIESGNLHVWEV